MARFGFSCALLSFLSFILRQGRGKEEIAWKEGEGGGEEEEEEEDCVSYIVV